MCPKLGQFGNKRVVPVTDQRDELRRRANASEAPLVTKTTRKIPLTPAADAITCDTRKIVPLTQPRAYC